MSGMSRVVPAARGKYENRPCRAPLPAHSDAFLVIVLLEFACRRDAINEMPAPQTAMMRQPVRATKPACSSCACK